MGRQTEMDEIRHPHSTRQHSDSPQDTNAKLAQLTLLLTLLPTRKGLAVENEAFLNAYIEDLEGTTPEKLEAAIRRGRQHWKFFPRISELLTLIKKSASKGGSNHPFPQVAPGISAEISTAWHDICRHEFRPEAAISWLHGMVLVKDDGETVTFQTEGVSNFRADWVAKNHGDTLVKAWGLYGRKVRIMGPRMESPIWSQLEVRKLPPLPQPANFDLG